MKRPPYPLLSEFVRGYLHQDVALEHGDPSGAARAFMADLDGKSKRNLAKEAERMNGSLKGSSLEDLNAELARMGSQWKFDSFADFEKVLRILERGR